MDPLDILLRFSLIFIFTNSFMGLMISLYVGLFMEIMNIISYTIKVRTILVSIVILNLMRVIDKIACNLTISGLDGA